MESFLESGMRAKGRSWESNNFRERDNEGHPKGDVKAIGYVGWELGLERFGLDVQT